MKKSSKALNKEWKKKYVTLCDDGRLTYHPSLHVSWFGVYWNTLNWLRGPVAKRSAQDPGVVGSIPVVNTTSEKIKYLQLFSVIS